MQMSISIAAPRVVITSYDQSGRSIIASDTTSSPIRLASNNPATVENLEFSPFHIVQHVPVRRNEQNQLHDQNTLLPASPRAPPEGILFGSMDFPLGLKTAMHHTLSLGYGVILCGEVSLILEGGEEALLRAGDSVVQGGTEHAWFNRGTGTCRMVFVAMAREETGWRGEEATTS